MTDVSARAVTEQGGACAPLCTSVLAPLGSLLRRP